MASHSIQKTDLNKSKSESNALRAHRWRLYFMFLLEQRSFDFVSICRHVFFMLLSINITSSFSVMECAVEWGNVKEKSNVNFFNFLSAGEWRVLWKQSSEVHITFVSRFHLLLCVFLMQPFWAGVPFSNTVVGGRLHAFLFPTCVTELTRNQPCSPTTWPSNRLTWVVS